MSLSKLILSLSLLLLSCITNAAPFTSAINLVTTGTTQIVNTRTFTVPITVAGYYQVLVTEVPAATPACNPYIIGTICYYNTLFTVISIKEAGAIVPATAYLMPGTHKITVTSKVAPHARLVNEMPYGFSVYIFSVTGPL